MAKFFDFILQGSEATEENAYSAARGLDWQEIETQEANYPFLNYVDTVDGVGIWYNYGSDDYYFTDESEDLMENKKVIKITKEQLQQIVREGVERLHKQSLIENRIKQINEELGQMLGDEENMSPYPDGMTNDDVMELMDFSEVDFLREILSNGIPLDEQRGIIQHRIEHLKGYPKYQPEDNSEKMTFSAMNEGDTMGKEGYEILDTYFDTLSQALDSVRDKAMSLGYEVDEDSMFSNFGTGGISYETTKSANIELLKNGEPILSKSGKPLNRAISISIYRMPSGKYELTAYKTW